jgi:2-polyprenyl-3-methyl-5-hydroxy-6-metoxy-1,4-benzoquinol methylase
MEDKKRDFDKEAAQWDENPSRVKLASDVFASMQRQVDLSSSMRVMDFGCGTGLLTLQLAPLAGSVTGVDSSQGMLDILKAKVIKNGLNNVTTSFIDLDRGDMLTGDYDLIVSTMTLHHIKTIGPLLKQFNDCLVPGGNVCIADLDSDEGMFHGDNQGVFHYGFERPLIREALIEAGFGNIHDSTAAEVEKPVLNGDMRRFTVFLITGQKLKPAKPEKRY